MRAIEIPFKARNNGLTIQPANQKRKSGYIKWVEE
jgi:hypothetical protein